MTVRNLATLDRDIFQPLGRILQEAFADGVIAEGTITRDKTIATAEIALFNTGAYQFKTTITGIGGSANIHGMSVRMDVKSACTSGKLAPFQVLLETTAADPKMDGLSWISAASWEWNLSKAGLCVDSLTNKCDNRFWHYYAVYAGIDPPTAFIYADGPSLLGGYYATGTPAFDTSGDACIPIKLGGNLHWLVALHNKPS